MNQLTGLNYINIGGSSRPIKFGTNQSAIYCQVRNVTLKVYLEEISSARIESKEMDGSEIRDLLFSALAAGCHSAKLPVDFDRFEVGDWIDDMPQEELNKAFLVLTAQNSPNGQGAKPTKLQKT